MNEIEIYKTNEGETQIEVKFVDESVWLSQKQMAVLFGRNRVAITQHIGNIFKEGELSEQMRLYHKSRTASFCLDTYL